MNLVKEVVWVALIALGVVVVFAKSSVWVFRRELQKELTRCRKKPKESAR